MSGSNRFFDTAAVARLVPYAGPRAVPPAAIESRPANLDTPHGAERPTSSLRDAVPPAAEEGRAEYRYASKVAEHPTPSPAQPAQRTQPIQPAAELGADFSGDLDFDEEMGRDTDVSEATPSAAAVEVANAGDESHDALPWIEAFLSEPEHAEQGWPFLEIGQRLGLLAQSLTPPESRPERSPAHSDPAGGNQPEGTFPTVVSMWTDSDWEESHRVPEANPGNAAPPAIDPEEMRGRAHQMNAEAAALALEGLAQRVRAGQLWVPAFQSERADEAVLAGLLAAMLGRREE